MARQVDRQPVQTQPPKRPERYPGESTDAKADALAPTVQQAVQQAVAVGNGHRRAMAERVMAQLRAEAPERRRQAQGGSN